MNCYAQQIGTVLRRPVESGLAPAVGVHDQPGAGLTTPVRRRERLADKIRFDPIVHRPTDDTTASKIHDHGQIQPTFSSGDIRDIANPGTGHRPAIKPSIKGVGRNRLGVLRIGRHAVRPPVHRAKLLALQILTYSFMSWRRSLHAKFAKNPRPSIAATATGVDRSNLHIQNRIGDAALARCPFPPLKVTRTRDQQQTAHPGDGKLVAIFINPGVLPAIEWFA